ncbi:MAG: hypothetical protein ACQES4_06915 [Bacillota bacterium]
MTPRNLTIFIAIDLAVLLFILLLLSYFGMSHLMLFMMGLVFLVLTLYDLQTGVLSAFFSDFLGFENVSDLGRLKAVPIVLSTLLLFLSLPVVLEHGLINENQRWAMQHGSFLRIAIPAIVGGVVVIAAAAWTVYRGSK